MFDDGLSWQSNNLSFWLSTLHGLSVASLEKTAREVHIGGSEFSEFFLSDHPRINFFGSPIFDRKKIDLVHTSDIGYPIKLGLHDGSVMRKCIMQISSAGEFEPASIGS